MSSEPAPEFTHADEVAEDQRLRMEADVEFAAAERMTFFSDAVVAIALTLLALELPVPDGRTVPELLAGLDHGLGEYIAFAISFAVISTHWRTHHRVFRYVNQVSRGLIALNMGWLFLIVITPWSTKLLSAGHINIVRFGQYAAIETIQYGLLLIMIVTLMRSDMLHAGTDLNRLRDSVFGVLPVMIGFALSIPGYLLLRLTDLSPYFSYAMWGVLPTVFGFVGRAMRSRRTAETPDKGRRRPPGPQPAK